MKNIFKILFVIVASGVLLFSCEDIETNFEELTNAPDPSATYYLQFIDASQSLETAVSESGDLVEIETTVSVALMGLPSSQDINVDLTLDPASTMEADMFTLSAQSITIPAGKTSGSVSLTTIAENMPVGEELSFIMNMDAGEHNNPNPNGTVVNYNMLRINFCPLVDNPGDLVGDYAGTDGAGAYMYNVNVTTSADGTELEVGAGLGFGFIADFWAETVTSGGNFKMTINGNGTIDIPRQYLFTTDYQGSPYDYEIAGTGKWENCGDTPRLILEYDIYYPGDDVGLAGTYSSYLDGMTYLTADITMQ